MSTGSTPQPTPVVHLNFHPFVPNTLVEWGMTIMVVAAFAGIVALATIVAPQYRWTRNVVTGLCVVVLICWWLALSLQGSQLTPLGSLPSRPPVSRAR